MALPEVFRFFSEARNLERLTPAFLNFKVVRMSTAEIQDGTLIDYRLKLRGIPMGWRTRISAWNPPHGFVDDQLKGPYALWHHVHSFQSESRDGREGTLLKDRVEYRLPLGRLGALVAGRFVKKDVGEIFRFRRRVITELFGS